jgi:hypothetical protein
LKADPGATPTNGSSQITAVVENPSGSSLSYSWKASAGKISGQTTQATWTAPATAGTYSVSLTVTDSKKRSTSASLSIQAVASSSSPSPAKIAGQVTDTLGVALVGASVKGTGPQSWSVTSDASGNYSSPSLPAGAYSVTASLNGYSSLTRSANAVSGSTVTLNFALTKTSTTGQVGGRVMEADTGSGIQSASVSGSGPQNWNVTTDGSGYYTSPMVTTGTYVVTATKSGHDSSSKSTSVSDGAIAQADFQLSQLSSSDGRDPAAWPFTTDSPWNYPIGSDAQYVTETSPTWDPSTGGYANIEYYSIPTYVATTTDPLRRIYKRKSDGTLVLVGAFRIPDSAVAAQGTDGHANVIDEAHSFVSEMYHFTRNANKDVITTGYNKNDLKGPGWYSSWHGSVAAGFSGLGGVIRKGELTSGTEGRGTGVRHALEAVISPSAYNRNAPGGRCFVWPASACDGGTGPRYSTSGNLYMGSLVAIPASVDITKLGIADPQALEVARAMQDYGIYLSDSGSTGSKMLIRIDPQAGSDIRDRAAFLAGINIAFKQLNIVSNSHANGYRPAVPGGGGTLRRALAPAFVTASAPQQQPLNDATAGWIMLPVLAITGWMPARRVRRKR